EVDLDLARLSLEKGQQVDHGDACELALEQIADRKTAPAVVDRNHDLVDILRLRVGRKRPFELRHALVVDDPVVALGRYEGADVKSAAIASSAQLQQARRSRARAVDEHLAP